MKIPLYLKDCYLKETGAIVEDVSKDKFIILDKNIFYPNMGGQPYDTGTLTTEDGTEYKVVYVGMFGGKISHEVDKPGLRKGDNVQCKIDWERRYTLMKMHTAAHVLSRVIHEDTGANTSGNQLGIEKSRIDFTLENFDREKIPGWFQKSNEIIKKNLGVEKSFLNRDEAYKLQGFASVSPHLVKDYDELRVVDIKGFDAQPCGGTHLDNIFEIGGIEFVKAENKGAKNRRIYFKLK
ncbi:alanyl-tRNA editing protein [Candidatus Woesearchaeota archaeon]|nr:alanyl-tRNA editing protein [Candidatus Woesearchaeota archaeon]